MITIRERIFDVIDRPGNAQPDHISFDLNRDVKFSTRALESFAFARWEPVIYDTFVLAAAVEFADKSVKRASKGWQRRLTVNIPVHDPNRWQSGNTIELLESTLGFLTGDKWSFLFHQRAELVPPPAIEFLPLDNPIEAVLAYSDGMDSRSVAGLTKDALGNGLARVRVGSAVRSGTSKRIPFTAIPYEVKGDMPNRENSARSRGFKFALLTAVAAYLTKAQRIVVPESGQGALGPALVTAAHGYPDYRNHPSFLRRMEKLVQALLEYDVKYEFPRLWNTKAETLRAYVDGGGNDWADTKSCWRNSQWSSVNGKARQCGVCAACMLRRMSIHGAGLTEKADTYICDDLSAPTIDQAAAKGFKHLNDAFRQYAIAGTMHLDHLAALSDEAYTGNTRTSSALLSLALELPVNDVERRLHDLLNRHTEEWREFMTSLGPNSFVRKWARFAK